MHSATEYDPAGKGVKMRTKESDAVGQAGVGSLLWPVCVILALFVGYFVGVNQGGEQASASPLWGGGWEVPDAIFVRSASNGIQ